MKRFLIKYQCNNCWTKFSKIYTKEEVFEGGGTVSVYAERSLFVEPTLVQCVHCESYQIKILSREPIKETALNEF